VARAGGPRGSLAALNAVRSQAVPRGLAGDLDVDTPARRGAVRGSRAAGARWTGAMRGASRPAASGHGLEGVPDGGAPRPHADERGPSEPARVVPAVPPESRSPAPRRQCARTPPQCPCRGRSIRLATGHTGRVDCPLPPGQGALEGCASPRSIGPPGRPRKGEQVARSPRGPHPSGAPTPDPPSEGFRPRHGRRGPTRRARDVARESPRGRLGVV